MPSAAASLLRLFLPDFILENLEFKGVIEDSETFHIELDQSQNSVYSDLVYDLSSLFV